MHSRQVLAFNYSTCESKFLSGEYGLSGAVDQNGNSVSSLNQTQGLRYQQCVEICGDGYQLEGWTGICSQVANSLLPWIALAAQLPFSTTDKWQDMFTVVLVIGSPILAMYSLLLSLFNAKWVKEDCGRVARSTLHGEGHMNHVARVLAACQHVPLAIKDQRALCWSIAGQENRNWWVKLAEMLKDKERGFPASLWAQIGVAALTYIFTIIDIFTNSEGMIWIWIAPIVFGWYAVHTPCTRHSIRDALRCASLDLHTPQGHPRSEPLSQREVINSRDRFLVWTVAGDEEYPGPFFNYARCFSWVNVAKSIISAHEAALQRYDRFHSLSTDNHREDHNPPEDNRSNEPLLSFRLEHREEIRPALNGMIKAFFWAIVFHAIPMTMAMVTCYLTPAVGFGCCSLPVVLVLGASLVAAALIILSTILSTLGMRGPRGIFRYWTLVASAAVARTVGKIIAFLNAIALIGHCLLTFAGVYNNCYCNSSRFGLQSSAYIVFLSVAETQSDMFGTWVGCLIAALVGIIFYTFYLVLSGRDLFKPLD